MVDISLWRSWSITRFFSSNVVRVLFEILAENSFKFKYNSGDLGGKMSYNRLNN